MKFKQFLVLWVGGSAMYIAGNLEPQFHWWTLAISLPAWTLMIFLIPKYN